MEREIQLHEYEFEDIEKKLGLGAALVVFPEIGKMDPCPIRLEKYSIYELLEAFAAVPDVNFRERITDIIRKGEYNQMSDQTTFDRLTTAAMRIIHNRTRLPFKDARNNLSDTRDESYYGKERLLRDIILTLVENKNLFSKPDHEKNLTDLESELSFWLHFEINVVESDFLEKMRTSHINVFNLSADEISDYIFHRVIAAAEAILEHNKILKRKDIYKVIARRVIDTIRAHEKIIAMQGELLNVLTYICDESIEFWEEMLSEICSSEFKSAECKTNLRGFCIVQISMLIAEQKNIEGLIARCSPETIPSLRKNYLCMPQDSFERILGSIRRLIEEAKRAHPKKEDPPINPQADPDDKQVKARMGLRGLKRVRRACGKED